MAENIEKRQGTLFIIAGPAGVGKTVLLNRLIQAVPTIHRSVTATTRPMRAGEVDGHDYYFFTLEDFEKRVALGEFIEWNLFAGYKYGTLRAPIMKSLATGGSQVMSIDVHGAVVFKKEFPNLISFFIVPPSFEALRERMVIRNQNTPAHMAEKLEIAKEEMKHQKEFDYIIVNDDLERAVEELVGIVKKHL